MTQRAPELTCRYGGEESVLKLPNIDKSHATLIAERCLKAVQNLKIPHETSTAHSVLTISVGGCTVMPSKEINPNSLFERADKQLYLVKENGRNQFHFEP